MKYKLKELVFDKFDHTVFTSGSGKIINLKETYEFQTPRVKVVAINTECITLQLLPSEASRIFFTKIHEFEQKVALTFKEPVVGLFKDDTFKVKIKNIDFKVYFNGNLFNIHHIKPGAILICLISISKLWIHEYIHYTLHVNEIVVVNV
jgi:hypothetical protein